MKKKILIIGGCGFIGHNLALHLKKNNFEPYVVDSLGVNNILTIVDNTVKNKKLYSSILNKRIELIQDNNIPFFIKDARNYHELSKIFDEVKPDKVIHLAAVSHANKSNKDPHTTFDHSLRTLENVLDNVRINKTHLIYLSSSMVYGNFEGSSVNENTICKPIGIYGTLKYAGELIIKSYNQVFDLPFTIVRPSALYGERCVSRRVGQIFIENSLQGSEIIVNGNGDEKLDFTYIEDLLEGIKLICENDKSMNETFNITYGEGRSVNDLIKILKDNFPNQKVQYKSKEEFSPERGTLDTSKAKKILNYQSKFSIEKGYNLYIDWYKKFYSTINNE
jgi:nucleoside-diphosphate-sugar epimerase